MYRAVTVCKVENGETTSFWQDKWLSQGRLMNKFPLLYSQAQGSPNRWEPVRFDRLPVKPVGTGSVSHRYPTGQNSKFKFKFKK